MAKIYCKSSYLLRKDTSANWGNKNPVLRKGEQGLETDTGIIKIGDGATEYNSLPDDNIYFPKSRINKSVDDVKSYASNNFANALKGNTTEQAVRLSDISPNEHTLRVKVSSKNLFDETTLLSVNHTEDEEAYIFTTTAFAKTKNLTPNIKFKEKTSYTLRYTAKQAPNTGSTELPNPRLEIHYTDGTLDRASVTAEYKTITI